MALLVGALSACASVDQTSRSTADGVVSLPVGVITAQQADRSRERIAIGGTSKADVLAALGKAAAVLAFNSGFEVWVYRVRPPEQAKQADGELVMLFAPSGTLAKTRVRAGAPTR